jgi:hypothetical protein
VSALDEEAAHLCLVDPTAARYHRGSRHCTPSSWTPSPDLGPSTGSEGTAGGRGDAHHQRERWRAPPDGEEATPCCRERRPWVPTAVAVSTPRPAAAPLCQAERQRAKRGEEG